MKSSIIILFVFILCSGLSAQTNVWQPSSGHAQVSIWPGEAPDAQPVPGPERLSIFTNLIAGKPCIRVDNVSEPTMTVYPPKGKNTSTAIVVFPGGGYQCLAIDLEGTEICDWLTSIGITAVLLKYRVPTLKFEGYRESRQALQDAQRTVGLVRFHADKWHIDSHKIGVIGFSAGGHLVAATSTRFDKRLYPPIDTADKVSCRPDFAIALYPGHLWHPNKDFVLNPNIPVTGHTPPTFLVHAQNDPVDNVNHTLVYYIALKNAGVPVELHLYAEGAHAFGLRRTELPITRWPKLVETWLHSIGMTSDNTEVHRLIAALSSVEWREREQAAMSLSSLGFKARSAADHLIKRLSDEEWQVRRAAAGALSHRGLASEQAIPSLIAALADEEWQVRKPAAEALAILGPLSIPAVPPLIRVLGDEEWQVRKSAVDALAAIGPSASNAVPFLRNCLNDPEEQVQQAASIATRKIGAQLKKPVLSAEVLAFPDAEGFGRFAKGGRGGDVYHVTSLSDSGPGSLRQGIQSATGPRTIVFAVSGTIELKSRLTVDKSNITLAGQTAPGDGDGITIKDHNFQIARATNVIVRYMRFRLGDENKPPGGYDTVTTDDIDHVIFDHCSLSWAIDGTHDLRRGGNFTLQWCILSEALNNSLHNKGSHAMCASYRDLSGNISLHHNLFSTCRDRHPSLGSAKALPQYLVDFRNNVIYNWTEGGTANFCDHFVNCVNNVWQPGPMSGAKLPIAMKGSLPDMAKGHMEGNIFEGHDDWTKDNYSALDWHRWLHPGSNYKYQGKLPDWKSNDAPLRPADAPRTQPAGEALELVLKSAGASLHRDTVDLRLIDNVLNRKGKVIDSQKETGGWPVLRAGTPPKDSDRDGMPDDWEKAKGLNPSDPSDRNGDRNSDGYTNLEEYLADCTVSPSERH